MTTKATSRFLFDLDQLPAKAPAEECLWMEIERLEAEKAELADKLTELEQVQQENKFYEEYLCPYS